jgi:hypothetical protein
MTKRKEVKKNTMMITTMEMRLTTTDPKVSPRINRVKPIKARIKMAMTLNNIWMTISSRRTSIRPAIGKLETCSSRGMNMERKKTSSKTKSMMMNSKTETIEKGNRETSIEYFKCYKSILLTSFL